MTEQRNPENVTEVRPDPVEDVVPPDPVQEDNGADDGTDDAAGLDLAWLWPIARIGGIALLVLLLVVGPFALIAGAKASRRRSRRTQGVPAAQIAGGWDEYVDAAIDSGREASATLTRSELAEVFATPAGESLATDADRAVFSEAAASADGRRGLLAHRRRGAPHHGSRARLLARRRRDRIVEIIRPSPGAFRRRVALRREGEAPGNAARARIAMNTIDDSTALGLGMLTFLLIVVLYVWTALALSAVFRKSGEQPWKAWVPIYNQVVLLQLGGYSGWLYLLILLPFLGPLLVWALLIAACYRINVAFGHGVGMTVLAALLLPVWASILGFGPARWLGTELTGRGAPGGGPRRTTAPDVDDTAAYVPRATPPAYTPSLPPPPPPSTPPPPAPPLPPASGWTPPPAAPGRGRAIGIPSRASVNGAGVVRCPAPPVAGRSGFEPQPDAHAGRWGGFDLGAVTEVTSEVTGADSAAPAPISAVPVRPAAPEAPVGPLRSWPLPWSPRRPSRRSPASGHPGAGDVRARACGGALGAGEISAGRRGAVPRHVGAGLGGRRGTGCRNPSVRAGVRLGAAHEGRDPRRSDRRDDHHAPSTHRVVARPAGRRGHPPHGRDRAGRTQTRARPRLSRSAARLDR